MTARFPNLFLVGAMRSGTTALHETLGRHPDIFMSAVKEPAYFADPAQLAADSRIASSAGFSGQRGRYLELFAGAGDARYVGESSTHYTKQPRITGVPERIAAAAPGARIIYSVRDPVDRTLSHYRYALRLKYERLRPLEALRNDPIYCAVSDYARQIEPYMRLFGEDAVRIVVLEELAAGPGALGELFAWLGVDPVEDESQPLQQRNEVAPGVQRARGPELLHRVGRTAGYQRIARNLVPGAVRTRVRRHLNQEIDEADIRSPMVLDLLRTTHLPHAAAMEQLLGRPMSRWTTLYGNDD